MVTGIDESSLAVLATVTKRIDWSLNCFASIILFSITLHFNVLAVCNELKIFITTN